MTRDVRRSSFGAKTEELLGERAGDRAVRTSELDETIYGITKSLIEKIGLDALLAGKQDLGATLTALEALSLVNGDILYATGPDTLVRLPLGPEGWGLVSDGTNLVYRPSRVIATQQVITGGTQWDFTVDPQATWVDVIFSNYSTTGGAGTRVQIGNGGVPQASGYASTGGNRGGETNDTDGFNLLNVAGSAISGTMFLRRLDRTSNGWVGSYSNRGGASTAPIFGGGRVFISPGGPDIVRIIANGDTGDLGNVNIHWGA